MRQDKGAAFSLGVWLGRIFVFLTAPAFLIIMTRTIIVLLVIMLDGRYHSVRSLIRAMSWHSRGLVLMCLRAGVEGGHFEVRGSGAGRRYRLVFKPPAPQKAPRLSWNGSDEGAWMPA